MADDVVPQLSVLDSTAVDPQQAVDAVFADSNPVSQPPGTPPVLSPQPLTPEPIEPPPAPTIAPPVAPLTPPPVISATEELPLGLATPPSNPLQGIGSIPAPVPPKPKKGRKVLAFLAGFVVLVSGILGGFYYYSNQFQKIDPIIAGVLTDSYTQSECHGCLRGGKLVWRAGECKVSGTCDPKDDALQWLNIRDATKCGQAGGVPCAGCGGFCNISNNRGCNDLQLAKCGEYPTYGANWIQSTNGECSGTYSKKCFCGTNTYCFDRDGYCGDEVGQASADTLAHGLCQITDDPKKKGDGIADKINDGEGTEIYFCANKFDDLSGGCQDQLVGSGFDMSCFCGTVQIDKPGQGFETKTMRCGCKDDKPTKSPTPKPSPSPRLSPSPSPSLSPSPGSSVSCTGLITNNLAPTLNSKVAFVCTGSTVPTGNAGLLTYAFRYNINGGAWQTLTNKSHNSAELTIVACGSYGVQCRACVTFGGKTQCDPIWQGATQ